MTARGPGVVVLGLVAGALGAALFAVLRPCDRDVSEAPSPVARGPASAPAPAVAPVLAGTTEGEDALRREVARLAQRVSELEERVAVVTTGARGASAQGRDDEPTVPSGWDEESLRVLFEGRLDSLEDLLHGTFDSSRPDPVSQSRLMDVQRARAELARARGRDELIALHEGEFTKTFALPTEPPEAGR